MAHRIANTTHYDVGTSYGVSCTVTNPNDHYAAARSLPALLKKKTKRGQIALHSPFKSRKRTGALEM